MIKYNPVTIFCFLTSIEPTYDRVIQGETVALNIITIWSNNEL